MFFVCFVFDGDLAHPMMAPARLWHGHPVEWCSVVTTVVTTVVEVSVSDPSFTSEAKKIQETGQFVAVFFFDEMLINLSQSQLLVWDPSAEAEGHGSVFFAEKVVILEVDRLYDKIMVSFFSMLVMSS